jgi:maleylacetoacetate isomerase
VARPILDDYWRSSAAYRVRIALNLKGVDYESRSINLAAGEQQEEAYGCVNPQGLVPALEVAGERITQSLAIIAYLDVAYPNQPLLPAAAASRAHVLALSLAIACDIHPLQNLRVNKYIEGPLQRDEPTRLEWDRHWIRAGFEALEALAKPRSGTFLYGDAPTMADVCLVPQMYNARRFDVNVEPYPTLVRAEANACALPAFAAAHPDRHAPE